MSLNVLIVLLFMSPTGFPPANDIENNSPIRSITNLESDIPSPELTEGSSAVAEPSPNSIDLVNNSDLLGTLTITNTTYLVIKI